MRAPLLISLVSLVPCAALAGDDGVYRWTDDRGETHFTNDLQTPPGDTVLTPVRGEELSVVKNDRPAPKPPSREELEVARLQAETRRAQAEAVRAEHEVRRGLEADERFWRNSFRDARRKIQDLEDALDREKAALTASGFPVTARLVGTFPVHCQQPYDCFTSYSAKEFEETKVRIKQLERDVTNAETELSDLERRASHAAVPREWRN